jgi:hypothetical protein
MPSKYEYYKWEDYINGMYDPPLNKEKDFDKALNIFNNTEYFKCCCLKVVNEWVISCDENLSNKNMNRVAWIGQSALNIKDNIKEVTTKKVWKGLKPDLKNILNNIAINAIKDYERRNKSLHKKMGESLF